MTNNSLRREELDAKTLAELNSMAASVCLAIVAAETTDEAIRIAEDVVMLCYTGGFDDGFRVGVNAATDIILEGIKRRASEN